ncbi:hypothetical protein [Streptomyces ficellus]|uniref:CU044_5270 family protein n=1 Tax=Streptomyces ficellus TaxID=1977088 RepID=A0A6I6FUS1_9ACTN|nr:hypothetical protein [Streptomyces ficellus]QGV81246.1 hypothetical protein EIZ62_25615 [Streptomyces ficellus]
MDEMRTLQDFRADAPAPDHARLTPGRQRLLDEAARPRRLRAGWLLATAGAAAAVTAVAVLVTLLPGSPEPPPPAVKPKPDQWVYRKTQWYGPRCDTVRSGRPGMEWLAFDLRHQQGDQPCSLEQRAEPPEEAWERYDGREERPGFDATPPAQTPTGARDNGAGSDTLTHRQADALVEDLPDDPGAALVLIRKRSIPSSVSSAWRMTRAQRDFEEIAEILGTATTVPEDKRKVLLRTAGDLEGARSVSTDAPGSDRKLTALWVEGNHRDYAYERNTFRVLIDPETREFRGFQLVAGMGYWVGGKKSGGPFVAKGTVLATGLRTATEVVGKPDQRP